MANAAWKEHAYPLKQVTIRLQGTRRSDINNVINLLDDVKAKLLVGCTSGIKHYDDLGYHFVVSESVGESAFGDEPTAQRDSR